MAGQIVEGDVDEYLRYHSDPYRRGYAQPDETDLRISEKKSDWQSPSGDELIELRDDHQAILTKLCAEIRSRHRRPHKGSLKTVYKIYNELPEPRMLYIPHQWRSLLMKVMGTPQKRDMDAMLRYFALLADIKSAGLTVRLTQWNYALAFVQQSKNWVTSQDNESALQLWREMEHQAGVRGNGVTFNILFDVASKAGNFVLADMIHKEMETRGIQPNRYNHVSLIHFFGLKQDADGMLAAYKEMVDAGELVDIVVLNCLISGFLRCGDEGAADQLYERMKEGLGTENGLPGRDYNTGKVMTQVLMMFAKVGRKHPALKESFQKSVPWTPDLQTYKLLIEHYAVRLGDLAKVTQYLDEMKLLDIPIHATIFLALIKGFFHWGGTPGTAWSKQRLDGVLSALYEARDQKVQDFRIRRWLVLWGMRAMKKCSGDNDEVERTFHDMSLRWDIPLDGQQFMEAVLEKILSDEDMNSPRGNWEGTLKKAKKDGSRL
ncbi:hypothetical protein CC79DRAFT_1274950 [Sarocladium strictum]|jgi:pentatricopeptide repeat protein